MAGNRGTDCFESARARNIPPAGDQHVARIGIIITAIADRMPERLAEREELASIRPELDGEQVMAHLGIAPGPMVGKAAGGARRRHDADAGGAEVVERRLQERPRTRVPRRAVGVGGVGQHEVERRGVVPQVDPHARGRIGDQPPVADRSIRLQRGVSLLPRSAPCLARSPRPGPRSWSGFPCPCSLRSPAPSPAPPARLPKTPPGSRGQAAAWTQGQHTSRPGQQCGQWCWRLAVEAFGFRRCPPTRGQDSGTAGGRHGQTPPDTPRRDWASPGKLRRDLFRRRSDSA